jgi:hypothetical protein
MPFQQWAARAPVLEAAAGQVGAQQLALVAMGGQEAFQGLLVARPQEAYLAHDRTFHLYRRLAFQETFRPE